ncbi:hypothetical protein GCM10020369_29060 [Cryptosporangium minutisporangium]|uniref:Hemerythrin-like domain-containing protein n=2 Tax=Cryptosporangium minutisporangium TaxID=113569 RepID=A0ABP6SWV2_9ACTN
MDLLRGKIDADAPRDEFALELGLFCIGFCVALNGHHRAEDGELFPRILAEHPDLVPVVEHLRQDHELLSMLLADLESVARTATADELTRHLDGVEAIMDSHFGYEERQLVAVLDAMTTQDVDVGRMFGVD